MRNRLQILPEIRTALILLILLTSEHVFSQELKGKVVSNETGKGIPFVNLGVIGKNVGTVTDALGNYSIELGEIYNNDSIRFSMIGFAPETFLISQFRKIPVRNVYMKPVSYKLQEVTVVYHKPKEVRLGYQVENDDLKSGFGYNDLGSELGVKIHVKGEVKLTQINFNVGICTYDSVTYRLNIYTMEGNTVCDNILKQPVYISFTKKDISKPIRFDLSPYTIVVDGDILVSLEMFRDLGQGRLLFNTTYFTDETYHKKTSEGSWGKSPGRVGISMRGMLIR